MKIVCLRVKQYMGIADLEVRHPGRCALVTGDNATGKSTVLKAIRAAFEGDGPQAIRLGADKAEILVDTDDLLTIRRVITPRGGGTGSVTVTRDGIPVPSPQTFLGGLVGPFNVDPTEFFLSEAADRKRMVLQAMVVECGIDHLKQWGVDEATANEVLAGGGHAIEIVDRAYKAMYARRRLANAEKKRAIKECEDARPQTAVSQVPPTVQSVEERVVALEQEESMCNASETEAAELERSASEKRIRASTLLEQVGVSVSELERFAGTREAKETELAQASQEVEMLATQISAVEVPDMAALRSQIELLQRQIAQGEQAETRRRSLQEQSQARQTSANAAKQYLEENERDNALAQERIATVQAEAQSLQNEAEALIGTGQTVEAIAEAKAGLVERRMLLENEMTWAQAAEAASESKKLANRLDVAVTALGKQAVPSLLREADVPIEGLGFEGDDVTLNGVPASRLSDREQMLLGIQIARALAEAEYTGNGDCKGFICADRFEHLDADSFDQFVELTQDDGYQYWCAMVARYCPQCQEVVRDRQCPKCGQQTTGDLQVSSLPETPAETPAETPELAETPAKTPEEKDDNGSE